MQLFSLGGYKPLQQKTSLKNDATAEHICDKMKLLPFFFFAKKDTLTYNFLMALFSVLDRKNTAG